MDRTHFIHANDTVIEQSKKNEVVKQPQIQRSVFWFC